MRVRGSQRSPHQKGKKGDLQQVSDDKVSGSPRSAKQAGGKKGVAETRQPSAGAMARDEAYGVTAVREPPFGANGKPLDRKKKGLSGKSSREHSKIQRFQSIRSPFRGSNGARPIVSLPQTAEKSPTSDVLLASATSEQVKTSPNESIPSPFTSQNDHDVDLFSLQAFTLGHLSTQLVRSFAMFEKAVGFNLCSSTQPPPSATTGSGPESPSENPGQEVPQGGFNRPFHTIQSTGNNGIFADTPHTPRPFKSTSTVGDQGSEDEPDIGTSLSFDISRVTRSFRQRFQFDPVSFQEKESLKPMEADRVEIEHLDHEIQGTRSRENKDVRGQEICRVSSDTFGKTKKAPGIGVLKRARSTGGALKTFTPYHDMRRTRSKEYRNPAKKGEGNYSKLPNHQALRPISVKEESKPSKMVQDILFDAPGDHLNSQQTRSRDQKPKKSAEEIRQVTSLVMDLTRESAKREAVAHPTRVVRVSTKSTTAKKRATGWTHPRNDPSGHFSKTSVHM